MSSKTAEQQPCPCQWPSDSIYYGMCEFTGYHAPGFVAPPTNTSSSPHPPATEIQLHPSSSATTGEAERFKFTDKEKMKELAEGIQPQNTTNATKWAVKTFEQWRTSRNSHSDLDSVPSDLYNNENPAILCKYLSMFVVEARKKNGDNYPPSTLHQILCGILRHMRQLNATCPNFLDKGDKRFKVLHSTLDADFHSLHADGIGIMVKHAEVITPDEEMKLWSSGVMGLHTPASLQNAVFYTVGKMFCLRGGQEHRSLRISQFIRLQEPDRYVYHENTSKNRNGSFKQLHIKPKIVPLYTVPDAGERCPVNIIDKYIDKLPKDAFKKDLFYVRPLTAIPINDTEPWYSSVPVGKNTLNNKIRMMCDKAKIQGNKTNHSLRATGATALFDSGIPEKVIQERTGHRSVEALRTYEHTTENQHRQVSSILSMATHVGTSSSKENRSENLQSSYYPSISFGHLHGCTININSAPPTSFKSTIAREAASYSLTAEQESHTI